MRIHRSHHQHPVRQSTLDQTSQPTRQRPATPDDFQTRARRSLDLTPHGTPVNVDELLQAIAERRAAAAAVTPKSEVPVTGGLEPLPPTPTPTAGDDTGRDEWTPPPPTPEVTNVSGFSPIAPPGVEDPRVTPAPRITEKRADTFPPQEPGESLAQYAMRTASKTGFQVSALGAFLSTAGSLGAAPNASFAELVDRFQNPSAYWTQADVDRINELRKVELQTVNTVYTGPIAASALTNDDRRYLMSIEERVAGVGDLFHRLLSGTHVEIARLINDTAYNLGTGGFDVSSYHGQLRPLVEQVIKEKGLVHP